MMADVRSEQSPPEEDTSCVFKHFSPLWPRRGKNKCLFWIAAALSFLFLTSTSHADEGAAPLETDAKKRPWAGEIETAFVYDNNVFQDQQERESDAIWVPTVSLSYRPQVIRWSGSATFYRYFRNKVLNYTFYEAGAERPFGEKSYGSLFLQFSPTAALDKEDPTVPTITLGSAGWTADFDRDLLPGWNAGVRISYNRLDYNDSFNAKDTDILKLGSLHIFRMGIPWQLRLDYLFENGSARGGTVPSGRRDDISYQAHAGSIQVSYRHSPSVAGRIQYRIRHKIFTTDLPEEVEPIHAGRRDTQHRIVASVRYRPFAPLLFRFQTEYLWRISTDPLVEFNEAVQTLSVAYLF